LKQQFCRIASHEPNHLFEAPAVALEALLRHSAEQSINLWPAPGSEDTELGVLMEPEVGHGETEVYTRVQT
jgi:hypothetical protein